MDTIKKYDNRRLYDTSVSSYITLEQLAEKIRSGTDVRVVHAKTDEDITQEVLAQIILESRGAARLLPVPLLMRLIRMGEDHLAEFFGQFMSWSLEMYLRFKKGAETMTPYNPFGNSSFSSPEAFFRMFMNQTPWGGGGAPPWSEGTNGSRGAEPPVEEPPPPEGAEPGEGGDEPEDVDDLRAEIDELKEMVRSMTGGEAPDSSESADD